MIQPIVLRNRQINRTSLFDPIYHYFTSHEIETMFSNMDPETEYINIKKKNIRSLPSILQFTNLKRLFCYDNEIRFLPQLPDSLEYIDCNNNNLIELPRLPKNLKMLLCYSNDIKVLPELPENLEILICGDNSLVQLPKLPNTLKELDIYSNFVVYIDELPKNLESLTILNNRIHELPDLPQTLRKLYCGYNLLSSLHDIPPVLCELSCMGNQITHMGKLPESLRILHCNNNRLKKLPTLPPNLNVLICSENEIEIFPMIPDSVSYGFNCENNNPSAIYPGLDIRTINVVNKFRHCYYYNKWKWRFLEYYVVRKMHPDRIAKLLENDSIELENIELYL